MQTKKYEQMAFDEAKKSKCTKRQVGCTIVNDQGGVIGSGHNHSLTCTCSAGNGCTRDVVHAEAMAITDAFAVHTIPLDEPLTLYVTQPPCNNCLRLINDAPALITVHVCEQFMKFDDDKLRFDLIPVEWEFYDAEVLTHGAKKYKPNNWQKGDVERYYGAVRRHLAAYRKGEMIDVDSGMPHLALARVNLGFLLTLEADKIT